MILYTSELYPTLGPLITQLCRNPVILSSKPIASLVVKFVLKYSNQERISESHNGLKDKEQGSKPERAWCAARLRDMVKASRQESRRGVDASVTNGSSSSTRWRGFGSLFQVSEHDMEQQRIEQTMTSLSTSLASLREMVQEKSLRTVDLVYLTRWIHQLSELCGPLVSHPASAPLIQGVVDTSCTLKARMLQSQHHAKGSSLRLLDAAFVKQVMAKVDEGGHVTTTLSSDQLLLRLCSVSDLARQTHVVQLIDRIMATSKWESAVVQSRDTVIHPHLERSRLFAAISSNPKEGCALLLQPLLEDLSGLTAQMSDWRLVRICTVLVEWMITTRVHCEQRMELGDDDSQVWENKEVLSHELDALISSACSIVRHASLSTDQENVQFLLDTFLTAQTNYVFCSAGPEHLSLRRKLAFLVTTAVSQHGGFLVHRIRYNLETLRAAQEERSITTNTMDDALSVPASPAVVLMAQLMASHDSDATFCAVAENIAALLKKLQELYSGNWKYLDQHMRNEVQLRLAAIMQAYQHILQINWTLAADLLCALGLYLNVTDSASWQSMIQAAFSRTELDSSVSIASSPIVAQLWSYAECIPAPELQKALQVMVSKDK